MSSPRLATAGVLAATVMALLAGCGPTGTPDLEVNGAAQAAEPVSGSSQIVLDLHNRGDGDDVLVEVATPAALGVDIHRTTIEEGRASMNALDEVDLPAGETVRFRPGGLHLMMVVPDDTVVLGGRFDLTLRFERADPLTVPVEVVDLLDLAESSFEEPDVADDVAEGQQ